MSSRGLSATEWAFGVGLEQAMGWPCQPIHCDPIEPHTSDGRGRIHHEARNIVHPTRSPWLCDPDAYLLPQEQADVRRLCDMVDSEWTLEREEGEWKMFMQTDPATGGIRYMGQVPVRSSRERLAGFLHSVPQAQDKWKIIDPKLETYVVLESRSPKHILAYRVTAAMSSYASMRDDVVMNVCTPVDDDVCVVTMRSDEHEDFPDREGGLFDEYVRVRMNLSGWHVRNLGDGDCMLSAVFDMDTGGWIPSHMGMEAMAAYPLNIKRHFEQ